MKDIQHVSTSHHYVISQSLISYHILILLTGNTVWEKSCRHHGHSRRCDHIHQLTGLSKCEDPHTHPLVHFFPNLP